MDMICVKIIGTCSEMQDTNGYHPAADSTSDLSGSSLEEKRRKNMSYNHMVLTSIVTKLFLLS